MVSRIRPRYVSQKANTPIILGTAPVEITAGNARLIGDGTAYLQLVPRDRVIVKARFREFSGPLPLGLEPLTMRFGEKGRPTRVLSVQTSSSNNNMEMDLLSTQGPFALCRDRRVRLREIIFHVLNFPDFLSIGEGSTDFNYQSNGVGRRLGRVLLSSGDWLVEIQALPNTAASIKQLKSEGGSAITHVGQVSRTDGRSFTILAAERAVNDLHRFLSFARGLHTAIFGVVGISASGGVAYEDWGTRLSTPWESPLGWFDIHHGQMLAQVYPGFVSLLHDSQMQSAVGRAVYWYLRSNRAGGGAGVDSGLLLSQAALERLAVAHLSKAGRAIPRRATDCIREALRDLRLPIAISRLTPRLLAGRRRRVWNDGPHAIAVIRNELVHGRDRLSIPLGPVISEAWQLAQWYVELLILRLAGYGGTYSNRLNPGWIGTVESVPWVRAKSRGTRSGSHTGTAKS